MKNFCIVLPVYKENINEYEKINLLSLINILNKHNYDAYLICPKKLKVDEYLNIYDKFLIKHFPEKYFKGIHEYSQLCLQYSLYSLFKNYKYMYFTQLDVYFFKDEFEYWTTFDYDYIGGPVFSTLSGWKLVKNGKYWPKVGNGGFSLRKVETFMDITNPNGEFRKTYDINDDLLNVIYSEDKYFCNDIEDLYYMNIPDFDIALKFSWDLSIEEIHKILNIDYLPMAAHATNINYEFYCNIIDEYKTDEIAKICLEYSNDKKKNIINAVKKSNDNYKYFLKNNK